MSEINVGRLSVTVIAEIASKQNGSIIFRKSCGTATREDTGEVFEISHRLGTGEPVVVLPDGRFVAFSWQSLVSAAHYAGEHFDVCQR